MLAVLEGAVSDFQKYATASGGRGRRLFAEAEAWLASTSTDAPLDFESICQGLGLDPSFIRAGLQRWCSTRRREPRRPRVQEPDPASTWWLRGFGCMAPASGSHR